MGAGTPDSLISRGRRTGWWTGLVIVVAAVVEMAVIVGQVIRGRRSHFNNETPLDEALFSVMGTTVVVLWLGTLVLAVALWRRPLVDRSATWAIRLGSAIGLGGLALGFLMTSPTDAHALQLLPLLALALAFAAGRYGWALGDNARVRLILVSGAGYAGLVALTAWQALRGQALTSPDALTLGRRPHWPSWWRRGCSWSCGPAAGLRPRRFRKGRGLPAADPGHRRDRSGPPLGAGRLGPVAWGRPFRGELPDSVRSLG
ncbi:hypothetical protein [Streptomyces antarcticus]|uniref:hypothetical protein n=1 Tax=Streptomyces antarcticus TaxID=2996458 RepID=UPI00226FAD3B|nr:MULTISPECIES: hypothetical protein [unclassified Streptomyces]MCY0947317.1 hypothetical protein [Streptomyces sp. H34-AA3]MCZ4087114.1 hypothetical protein [Streptomyces sp. H34-S5]